MDSSKVTQRSALIVALALAVGGGFAAAQGKTPPAGGAKPPAAGKPAPAAKPSAPASETKSCPMHDAMAIADVTAENTADGAVIRLKAKKPGDAQRVQEMAAMMAKHMTGGGMDCCMDHDGMGHDGMGHGGMMHGDMDHGGMGHGGMMDGHHPPGPKPAAAPSNPQKH